jgi:hypothetical protein
MIRDAVREKQCLADTEEAGVIFDRCALIGNAVCRLRERHVCKRWYGNAGVGIVEH